MRDSAGKLDAGAMGLLLVAAAGLVWGTIPLAVRAADGASVIKVFYRVFFGSAAVWAWMIVRGRTGEVTSLPGRKLLQIAGQGAILAVNWALFLAALDMTNVATAELLGYTGPVFVALLAPLVTRERFDARILIPLAAAMGGVAVILIPQGVTLSGRSGLGALLAAASALTFAAILLRSKNILRGVTGMALMAVEYPVASVLLVPFVAWAYAHGQGPSTAVAYGALAVLGIVHTALAGMVFLAGLRRVRADRAAILTYAEPVSAVLFAAVFLAEPLSVWTIVGGAMVVAGGLAVARLGTPEAPIEAIEAEEPQPAGAEAGQA